MGFTVTLKILVKANLLSSLAPIRWELRGSMSSVPDLICPHGADAGDGVGRDADPGAVTEADQS
jgi:hypothetical protein